MNYQKHYDCLIDRARRRTLVCYSERHHIIPRCLGGGNEKCNLVRLTAEEHYVAHQLLVQIYPDSGSLAAAAWMMSTTRGNKMYGWLRRRHAKAHRKKMIGRVFSEETLTRMSVAQTGEKNPMFGRITSAETKAKISAAGLGRIVSAETRIKMGAWQKGKPKSLEATAKMRVTQKGLQAGAKNGFFGKQHTEETRAKMRLARERRRAIS